MKSTRLRKPDALLDRDVAMLCDQLRGVRSSDIARKFGISKQLVCRRLKRMPSGVRAYARRRMAHWTINDIFVGMHADDRKAIRRIMKAAEKAPVPGDGEEAR
ncbi:hypothetical protein [Singulisphaera sp. PoT]|uniref:hypothetical protein n=1 Tax=Singulisphaera sp. PoT TaxID=3411797 RepID=UPI003BF48794